MKKQKKRLFIYLFISIQLFSLISSLDYPSTAITISWSGNLTNLSQLFDVNIPSPTDGQSLVWQSASSRWIASTISAGGGSGNLSATSGSYLYDDTTTVYFNETKLNATIDDRSVSASDTNESVRFNTLVGTDCGAGDYVYGVNNNGLLQCSTPAGSGGGNFYFANFSSSWNSNWTAKDYDKWMYNQTTATYNLYNSIWSSTYNSTYDAKVSANLSWNETRANLLYAPIGAGSDNASWNQSYANTLYSNIQWNYNQTTATYNLYDSRWYQVLWDSVFNSTLLNWLGTRTTNDLPQGTTNKYDNQSWNETRGNLLYAPIGIGGDNASWNQSYANILYISSGNLSIYNGLINNASYLSTYNATYDAKISFNNTNIAYVNNSNTFTQPQIISNNLNATNITIGGATIYWNGTHLIFT